MGEIITGGQVRLLCAAAIVVAFAAIGTDSKSVKCYHGCTDPSRESRWRGACCTPSQRLGLLNSVELVHLKRGLLQARAQPGQAEGAPAACRRLETTGEEWDLITDRSYWKETTGTDQSAVPKNCTTYVGDDYDSCAVFCRQHLMISSGKLLWTCRRFGMTWEEVPPLPPPPPPPPLLPHLRPRARSGSPRVARPQNA